MPVASPLHPFHAASRLVVVADLARALIVEHGTADAALAHACGLSDAAWLDLAHELGHYLRPGEAPADDTIAGVLTTLERIVPAPEVIADPFHGIPA